MICPYKPIVKIDYDNGSVLVQPLKRIKFYPEHSGKELRVKKELTYGTDYSNARIYKNINSNTPVGLVTGNEKIINNIIYIVFPIENYEIENLTYIELTVTADQYLWKKINEVWECLGVYAPGSVYIDKIVEQGEPLTYGLTFNDIDPNNVSPVEAYADFEDIFISDSTGKNLRIRYDAKINSFKTIIQEQKIETLGSKYPYFYRNGAIGYKEFPVSGILTYELDENLDFFTDDIKTKYFSTESHRATTQDKSNFVGLTSRDQIFLERKFKLAVEEWLREPGVKLLRTATEGNYLVRLTDISLSPMEQLGRRLHSFSATAIEVHEYSLTELEKLGFLTTFSDPENVGSLIPNSAIAKKAGEINLGYLTETSEDGKVIYHSYKFINGQNPANLKIQSISFEIKAREANAMKAYIYNNNLYYDTQTFFPAVGESVSFWGISANNILVKINIDNEFISVGG